MAKNYLTLDIGGTFIKYAIMTDAGAFVLQGKVPALNGAEEELLASLADVRNAVASYSYEGVAVSMPGTIDTARGIARTGGAFGWIRDWPVAERLEALFGKPVTAANDGKCAAHAESSYGALRDVDSGCVLVLGTGIGGGIVLGKQVLMGATGGAGELSAVMVDFTALADGFGREAVPAMWANHVSARALTERFAELKGIDHADGIMLFDAYEVGDEDAKTAMDYFGKMMAAGIFSLQATLDVQRYAIGGGISARPETTQIVRDAVDALFDPVAGMVPFGKPEIVTCRFGNEANLLGALAFHLER